MWNARIGTNWSGVFVIVVAMYLFSEIRSLIHTSEPGTDRVLVAVVGLLLAAAAMGLISVLRTRSAANVAARS